MKDNTKCPRKYCRGILTLDPAENQLVCTSCSRRFDPVRRIEVTDPSITFNDKPGKVQSPTGTESLSQPEGPNNIETEDEMPGKVNAEDLHTETLVKIGTVMPPKPDVSGLNKGESMQALGKYYDDNKELIKDDLEALGKDATIKKWGISQSGWQYKRARLFPDRYDLPERKKKKEPSAKKPDPGDFDPVHNAHVEVQLSYYMGYHQCVQDFLKAGVIR